MRNLKDRPRRVSINHSLALTVTNGLRIDPSNWLPWSRSTRSEEISEPRYKTGDTTIAGWYQINSTETGPKWTVRSNLKMYHSLCYTIVAFDIYLFSFASNRCIKNSFLYAFSQWGILRIFHSGRSFFVRKSSTAAIGTVSLCTTGGILCIHLFAEDHFLRGDQSPQRRDSTESGQGQVQLSQYSSMDQKGNVSVRRLGATQ